MTDTAAKRLQHVLARFNAYGLNAGPSGADDAVYVTTCPTHRDRRVTFDVDELGIWVDRCPSGCLPLEIARMVAIDADRAQVHSYVALGQRAALLGAAERSQREYATAVASGRAGRLGATAEDIHRNLINLLEERHPHPTRRNRYRCPVCDDTRHGGVKVDLIGGSVTLYCHNRCGGGQDGRILAELGLSYADLRLPLPAVDVDPAELGYIPTPNGATGPTRTEQHTAPVVGWLPDDFWTAREYLRHIRAAAHSRQRSAPAVLGVVLARVAAFIPHRLRLPAVVGSDAGLSLLVLTLAPPGIGKSTGNDVGATLLGKPFDLDALDGVPLGTGEGLAEMFMGVVLRPTGEVKRSGPNKDEPKMEKVRTQVRHNVFVYVDEGEIVEGIGRRSGATLLPTLRSVFTGSTLGQYNASADARRIVPARSYTLGMVIGMQTVLAGALLDDAAAGTPQRLLWVPAHDPTINAAGMEWPGPLSWVRPLPHRLDGRVVEDPWYDAGRTDAVMLEVAATVADEIRAVDLARVTGRVRADPLDAHAGLMRLKVAALLALLDGSRLNVNEEDWQLAGALVAASNGTRDHVIATVRDEASRKEGEYSTKLARRAAHSAVGADAAVAQRRVIDCARKIAAKVWAEPERWSFAELRRDMSRWRDAYADGVEHAIAEGWVTEVTSPGQGDVKRLLRPGPTRA